MSLLTVFDRVASAPLLGEKFQDEATNFFPAGHKAVTAEKPERGEGQQRNERTQSHNGDGVVDYPRLIGRQIQENRRITQPKRRHGNQKPHQSHRAPHATFLALGVHDLLFAPVEFSGGITADALGENVVLLLVSIGHDLTGWNIAGGRESLVERMSAPDTYSNCSTHNDLFSCHTAVWPSS